MSSKMYFLKFYFYTTAHRLSDHMCRPHFPADVQRFGNARFSSQQGNVLGSQVMTSNPRQSAGWSNQNYLLEPLNVPHLQTWPPSDNLQNMRCTLGTEKPPQEDRAEAVEILLLLTDNYIQQCEGKLSNTSPLRSMAQ